MAPVSAPVSWRWRAGRGRRPARPGHPPGPATIHRGSDPRDQPQPAGAQPGLVPRGLSGQPLTVHPPDRRRCGRPVVTHLDVHLTARRVRREPGPGRTRRAHGRQRDDAATPPAVDGEAVAVPGRELEPGHRSEDGADQRQLLQEEGGRGPAVVEGDGDEAVGEDGLPDRTDGGECTRSPGARPTRGRRPPRRRRPGPPGRPFGPRPRPVRDAAGPGVRRRHPTRPARPARPASRRPCRRRRPAPRPRPRPR